MERSQILNLLLFLLALVVAGNFAWQIGYNAGYGARHQEEILFRLKANQSNQENTNYCNEFSCPELLQQSYGNEEN